MINTGCLLAVFVCIQCHNLVYCVSDLSGKEFVLAFPTFSTTDRQVHFFIYTLEVLKTIEVNLFTKWTDVKAMEINNTFELNREQMKHYISEEKFSFLTEEEQKIDYGHGMLRFVLPRSDINEKYTYVLTSKDLFYVSVLIVDSSSGRISMASMQGVPTQGWGTSYIAVTLSYQPSIQIVTSEENKVTIRIRSPGKKFYGRYREMYYTDTGFMTIHLQSYQGFSLQTCPFNEINYGELTGNIFYTRKNGCLDRGILPYARGKVLPPTWAFFFFVYYIASSTLIQSEKPIGVITGNCAGLKVGSYCDKYHLLSKADMVMEMILPEETYGNFYVLYGISDGVLDGIYCVVASKEGTVVEHRMGSFVHEYKLNERGKHILLQGIIGGHFVQSSKPVGVYFYIDSCKEDSTYSALSLIVPVGLFMDVYIWRTFETKQMKKMFIKHYIKYTCLLNDVNNGLVLDGVKLTEYNHKFMNAFWKWDWQVGTIQIQPGMHEFFSKNSSKFGVYVYGLAKTVAYIYPAGFISAPLNPPTPCVPTGSKRPVRGDLIDDDCDGYIDEERFDNVDEDNDKRKDEDIMPLAPKNGSWSQWNPWWCASCFSSNKTRSRQCNNPLPIRGGHNCPGPRVEMSHTNCHNICKAVHGAWGDWEIWTCSNHCNRSVRTRKCDNPPPKFGGLTCSGPSEQNQRGICLANCPYVTTPRSSTTKDSNSGKSSRTEKLTSSGIQTITRSLTTTSARLTTSGRLTTTGNVTTSERLTISGRPATSGRWTTTGRLITSGRWTTSGNLTTTERATATGKVTIAGNMTNNSTRLTTDAKQWTARLPRESTSSTAKRFPKNVTAPMTSLKTTVPTVLTVLTPPMEKYTTLDYSESPPRDGMWSEWTKWTCPLNCHEKKMQRIRLCDNPSPEFGGMECLGPPFQLTEDDKCHYVCPDDCPDGRWGLNCTNACPHCENPCDKNTGSCTSCKPGWRLPSKSCLIECDKYFYGYDCRGSCIRDCEGRDCLERVLGTCPEKRSPNYWYLLLLLVFIPMAVLCYLPHKYKRRFSSDDRGDFIVGDSIVGDSIVDDFDVDKAALLPSSRHTVASDHNSTEV